MKTGWIWVIAIFVLLIILIVAFFIYQRMIDTIPPCFRDPITVIDGDTFKIPCGPTVRLLCVDTPEKGEEGYEEAKAFLENLILYKEVNLISSNYGGNDTDKYGRLLRWVYVKDSSGNQIFVNKLIIDNSYGDILIIPPETCEEVSD